MSEPIWLTVARAFDGLAEVPGPGNNPVILNWVGYVGAPKWYDRDSHPWCGLFASVICKATQLPAPGKGFDLIRALTFAKYGRALRLPTLGAFMVFGRSGGHHVGWYLGERNDAFRIFGANQSDKVCATWIQKDRLVEDGIRWPDGHPLPLTGAIWLKDDGAPLSSNEA